MCIINLLAGDVETAWRWWQHFNIRQPWLTLPTGWITSDSVSNAGSLLCKIKYQNSNFFGSLGDQTKYLCIALSYFICLFTSTKSTTECYKYYKHIMQDPGLMDLLRSQWLQVSWSSSSRSPAVLSRSPYPAPFSHALSPHKFQGAPDSFLGCFST